MVCPGKVMFISGKEGRNKSSEEEGEEEDEKEDEERKGKNTSK